MWCLAEDEQWKLSYLGGAEGRFQIFTTRVQIKNRSGATSSLLHDEGP